MNESTRTCVEAVWWSCWLRIVILLRCTSVCFMRALCVSLNAFQGHSRCQRRGCAAWYTYTSSRPQLASYHRTRQSDHPDDLRPTGYYTAARVLHDPRMLCAECRSTPDTSIVSSTTAPPLSSLLSRCSLRFALLLLHSVSLACSLLPCCILPPAAWLLSRRASSPRSLTHSLSHFSSCLVGQASSLPPHYCCHSLHSLLIPAATAAFQCGCSLHD